MKAEEILGNKFCTLEKMEFEMSCLKQASIRYYDIKTFKEIK